MEFTLIVLAVSGGYVLWKGTPMDKAVRAAEGMTKERRVNAKCGTGFLLLSLLFTATAFFGWWTTEVMYDQQVVYSNYALTQKSPN
jgi:hypothetical protein